MKYRNGRDAQLNDPVVTKVGNEVIVGNLTNVLGDDGYISNVLHGFIVGVTAKISDCFHADDAFHRVKEYTEWKELNFH